MILFFQKMAIELRLRHTDCVQKLPLKRFPYKNSLESF